MIISVDGASAVGKSSISKLAAKQLSCLYIDSGAMYRAFTYKCLCHAVSDESSVGELILNTKFDFDNKLIFIDGIEVSSFIRHPDVDSNVAQISAFPTVTKIMIDQQKRIAQNHSRLLMEGRNIGTAVFPEANYKFYITASYEVRSMRRLKDYVERGVDTSLSKIMENLIARDKADIQRSFAPMKQPKNAIILDTSNITVAEAVKMLVDSIIR